jgi:hypothetical protein
LTTPFYFELLDSTPSKPHFAPFKAETATPYDYELGAVMDIPWMEQQGKAEIKTYTVRVSAGPSAMDLELHRMAVVLKVCKLLETPRRPIITYKALPGPDEVLSDDGSFVYVGRSV